MLAPWPSLRGRLIRLGLLHQDMRAKSVPLDDRRRQRPQTRNDVAQYSCRLRCGHIRSGGLDRARDGGRLSRTETVRSVGPPVWHLVLEDLVVGVVLQWLLAQLERRDDPGDRIVQVPVRVSGTGAEAYDDHVEGRNDHRVLSHEPGGPISVARHIGKRASGI